MREIKFRGFSKTLNKWIIGVPYFSEGNWWILVDENTKSDDIGTGSYFVDKNSIGQHTGLKDKNGVLIFEGDIVTTPYRDTNSYIYYSAPSFGLRDRIGICTDFTREDFNEFEVIGNLYQNPELLEQNK